MTQNPLSSTYGQLPPQFFSHVNPTPVAGPRLIKLNRELAGELGLDVESDVDTLAEQFSGNIIMPGSEPLAMAYAGHQFGQFVPQLGDGRAVLLGEARDAHGRRRDIQLKGAGRTPYSRGGDGRAAVGPVLREYVVSEAMHALGIPATRALAMVTTGESVMRDMRLPGAILTRVAASHVRVGTFQYFAARGDSPSVRLLSDYVIERHYPQAAGADNRHLELLRAVVRRQASLVAAWMNVGFIHGVMNTDNMTVSGETIDFGPCAFMDEYDPATVFSSIDHMGRYAYSNQPAAAQWNLARFAETLLPLIDNDSAHAIELATDAVTQFSREYEEAWLNGMRQKLGLATNEEGDAALARGLLETMHRARADFTSTFRLLSRAVTGGTEAAALLGDWPDAWAARGSREPAPPSRRAALMRSVNPAFIPRNHRIEQSIAAAVQREDYAPFEELCMVLSRPYEDQPRFAAYADPPRPEERVLQTFCGT